MISLLEKVQMISRWKRNSKEDTRYHGIPERVLKAIAAQQEASETDRLGSDGGGHFFWNPLRDIP
jgi:hypothetical protein